MEDGNKDAEEDAERADRALVGDLCGGEDDGVVVTADAIEEDAIWDKNCG